MIARWQPVHNGGQPVLRALCEQAEHALIGIGSANRYNVRNPFTLAERQAMLRLTLAEYSNYTLLSVPDLDDGPRWRAMVLEVFAPLDLFVTDNPYVHSLIAGHLPTIRPVTLVPPEQRTPVSGTMVRLAMAHGQPWEHLVPPAIHTYLTENGLDERFRQEFGLQTIALSTLTSGE
jgi:nicotinamide-nucleotide adenylyltransferase